MPAIYATEGSVTSGGLVSYGLDFVHSFRQTAEYVDRILRGAKPADLPVQQPSKFKLTFNLKTAKAIGIKLHRPCLTAPTRWSSKTARSLHQLAKAGLKFLTATPLVMSA